MASRRLTNSRTNVSHSPEWRETGSQICLQEPRQAIDGICMRRKRDISVSVGEIVRLGHRRPYPVWLFCCDLVDGDVEQALSSIRGRGVGHCPRELSNYALQASIEVSTRAGLYRLYILYQNDKVLLYLHAKIPRADKSDLYPIKRLLVHSLVLASISSASPRRFSEPRRLDSLFIAQIRFRVRLSFCD